MVKGQGKIEVSVCVSTRARPAGLEILLGSLAAQRDAPPFEVVVIDNDLAGSARPVADRFADCLTIVYDVEPVPGVSTARNRSVARSRAPLLAFIDDDERAEPGWLAALYAKMADPRVAAAIGVVRFEFADDVPADRRDCGQFGVLEFEDGQALPWWGTWIGNSCVRRAALPDPLSPFDPALNLVGGEDSHLFAVMLAKGAHIVAARGAETWEYRTIDRMGLRQILGRALRGGATEVEIEWPARGPLSRLRFVAMSALNCLVNLFVTAIAWFPAPGFALQRLVIATGWAGRLARLAGWRYREYRIVR
jgi:succinoglycan biosynthesis protein ExoM